MVRLISDQRWIFRILRHVLLFVSMVLLFTWVVHTRKGPDSSYAEDLVMVLFHAVFFFGYAYLTVYLLIPKTLKAGKVLIFLFSFLGTGLALSSLKFLASDFIFYQAISPENATLQGSISLQGLLVNIKDMSFIVALFAIAKFARDHYFLESNIRELQQRGLEAEIKLLQHQMDPHVIFNNFNNLYSISIHRPEALACTVRCLKEILYYLFRESRHTSVKLAKELAMISNYISLEKLRFGERLDIDYQVDGEPGSLEIAPLVLYGFVENCFEHGAGDDPEKSWIRIHVRLNGNNLHFHAANSRLDKIEQFSGRSGAGFNDNSLRRLELTYPNSHRLTILDRPSEHIVDLNVRLAG